METLSQLVEDGLAIKRIAAKLNVSVSFVKDEIAKNNLQLKKEQFDLSKIEKILKLYSEGVSAKSLAQKFSIRKERVLDWAASKGLLRSKNESHRLCHFNECAFDLIDSPNKAYWIGFLLADGCNLPDTNTVRIGLKGSDDGHLKKMAVFFNLPEDKVKRKIRNDGADVAVLNLYSTYLCQRCEQIGIIRAKSLTAIYPKWLNKRLHRHFIRGIFDGDGSIKATNNEWNICFSGTENICKEISNIIMDALSIHLYVAKKKDENVWIAEISGNQQVLRFCSWMYEDSDSSIYLDRKYERFLILKDWLSKKESRKLERIAERQLSNG